MEDCIFCKIVSGDIPSRQVYEDEHYLAFLTRWPNTEGFTVLIPKKHYDSDALRQPDEVLSGMVTAAKAINEQICTAYPDVGRCGLIFEGFGVNHLHAKLVPMHGTAMAEWKPIHSDTNTYFETYPGYISSHDSVEQDASILDQVAEKIRNAKK